MGCKFDSGRRQETSVAEEATDYSAAHVINALQYSHQALLMLWAATRSIVGRVAPLWRAWALKINYI